MSTPSPNSAQPAQPIQPAQPAVPPAGAQPMPPQPLPNQPAVPQMPMTGMQPTVGAPVPGAYPGVPVQPANPSEGFGRFFDFSFQSLKLQVPSFIKVGYLIAFVYACITMLHELVSFFYYDVINSYQTSGGQLLIALLGMLSSFALAITLLVIARFTGETLAKSLHR